MIYELSVVANPAAGEKGLTTLKKLVQQTVKKFAGKVVIEDSWGHLALAQPTNKGIKSGNFLYFIFSANNRCNLELVRLFRINENHLRHLIVKLGEDGEQQEIVKAYKTPFSKAHHGSVASSSSGKDSEGSNPRKLSRRRACYFRSNNIAPDWKDPATYSWLINEFGKISPARVSGVSTKYQRFVTTAIKRARQIGLISHVGNQIAQSN